MKKNLYDGLIYHHIMSFLDMKTLLLPISKNWCRISLLFPEMRALRSQDYKTIWRMGMENNYNRLIQYYYDICMKYELLIPLKRGFYESCRTGNDYWINKYLENNHFKGDPMCLWSERSWMWDKALIGSIISGNKKWIEYFYERKSPMSIKIARDLSRHGKIKEAFYIMYVKKNPVSFSITESIYNIDEWMSLISSDHNNIDMVLNLFKGISESEDNITSDTFLTYLPIFLKYISKNTNNDDYDIITVFLDMLISKNVPEEIIQQVYKQKGGISPWVDDTCIMYPPSIMSNAIKNRRMGLISKLLGPDKCRGKRLRYSYRHGHLDYIKELQEGRKFPVLFEKDYNIIIKNIMKESHYNTLMYIIDTHSCERMGIIISLLSHWITKKWLSHSSVLIPGSILDTVLKRYKYIFLYIMDKYTGYKIDINIISLLKDKELYPYSIIIAPEYLKKERKFYKKYRYSEKDYIEENIISCPRLYENRYYIPLEVYNHLCHDAVKRWSYAILKGDLKFAPKKYDFETFEERHFKIGLWDTALCNYHYHVTLYMDKYASMNSSDRWLTIFYSDSYSWYEKSIMEEVIPVLLH